MMDTSVLRDGALSSLLAIIDGIRPSSKILILDKALTTSLSLITSFSLLKDHGVERIFWLQASNLAEAMDWHARDKSIVYLTSCGLEQAYLVSTHAQLVIQPSQQEASINTANESAQSTSIINDTSETSDINIILVPERNLMWTHLLEENRVLGDVTLHSWPVYFLPIDTDVLSLNIPNAGFAETYLDDTLSAIHISAQAIQDLQKRFGLIGRITGKGTATRRLADMLLHKREQRRTDLAGDGNSFDHKYANIFVGTNIEHLVIVDRISDLVTPLLTQLTYQGLIDEFYKISDSGQVELPASIVSPQPSHAEGSTGLNKSEMKKTSLYSDTDTLFHTIKDVNFAVVGQSLNKIARQLQSDYEQRHEAKTVSQIKTFVSKLGGLQTIHQSLRFHTNLAEDLMAKVQGEEFNKWLEVQQNIVAETIDTSAIHAMIEELINRSSPLTMVLRLLALDCLCKGGIKEKQLLSFKHQIVQAYGHKHIVTLSRLEKLGLLFARAPSIPNNFPNLRNGLNLIVDQQDDVDPKDISFTYSGYAPLSVRIVQCVIDKISVLKPRRLANFVTSSASSLAGTAGWKGAEDIIKYIPGDLVEEQQRSESELREAKLRKILTRNTPGRDKTTTLVFFLGGVTRAEIAALRFVANKSENTNILIATTGLINGDKIMEACTS
jgi:hypothetical protein